MNPNLIIFDCDGVLVNSEPIASRIFHEIITEIGLNISLEETVRHFEGLSDQDSIRIIEEKLRRPVPDSFMENHDKRLFEALSRELDPIQNISIALEKISIPICVASSGPYAKIRLSLGVTQLLPKFEGRIFSAVEVSRGKPFPDLFLHAADKMGVSPQNSIVVEDSVYGVQAGVAAGMAVLGYAERTDPEVLRKAGATIFYDMLDLPELIENLHPD